jgi:hypothetical protein
MATPRNLSPRETLRIKTEALFRRMAEQEERAKEMTRRVHQMCDCAADMRKPLRLSWPQFE